MFQVIRVIEELIALFVVASDYEPLSPCLLVSARQAGVIPCIYTLGNNRITAFALLSFSFHTISFRVSLLWFVVRLDTLGVLLLYDCLIS